MVSSFNTFLGTWWVRLCGRIKWGRLFLSRGAEPPRVMPGAPPAEVAEAKEVTSPTPPAREEAETGMYVGAGTPATVEPFRLAPANPEARARSLASLQQLQQIPALQSFAKNFLRILGRTDVDVRDVVDVIAKDSALCVRVLRLANSVAVGSSTRIEDLDTAVQMLGVTRVRNTAQTLFTLRDGNRVADGFDWRHLWLHAIGTAEIAIELERRLRGEAEPSLHVAALLHDVGKIVLSMIAPDDYRAILADAWHERGSLEELERARLGVDHREAGVYFAREAGMPEMAVEAIAHHDRPEEAGSFRFEVALVNVANYVCKAHGLGFSGSRLDASEADFASLPAWRVIEAELGRTVRPEVFEDEIAVYAGMVRGDLKEMREGA